MHKVTLLVVLAIVVLVPTVSAAPDPLTWEAAGLTVNIATNGQVSGYESNGVWMFGLQRGGTLYRSVDAYRTVSTIDDGVVGGRTFGFGAIGDAWWLMMDASQGAVNRMHVRYDNNSLATDWTPATPTNWNTPPSAAAAGVSHSFDLDNRVYLRHDDAAGKTVRSYYTTDAGETWNVGDTLGSISTTQNNHWLQVSQTGPLEGFVPIVNVTGDRDVDLWSTTDGGVSWSVTDTIVGTFDSAAGASQDATKWMVLVGDGSLVSYTTTDAGATWIPHVVSTLDNPLNPRLESLGDGRWLASWYDDTGDDVYYGLSNDDGTTWTTGIAADGPATISSVGGDGWDLAYSPTTETAVVVHFAGTQYLSVRADLSGALAEPTTAVLPTNVVLSIEGVSSLTLVSFFLLAPVAFYLFTRRWLATGFAVTFATIVAFVAGQGLAEALTFLPLALGLAIVVGIFESLRYGLDSGEDP